ncbi:CUB and sushi domain-containing protein 1-like [Sycon ciliatum]|uniref:CUB and sushi domain-containing protein 1-like n=1 Tax=Sycon ciliatum TaxID=27933 RepID=UPI0031F6170C
MPSPVNTHAYNHHQEALVIAEAEEKEKRKKRRRRKKGWEETTIEEEGDTYGSELECIIPAQTGGLRVNISGSATTQVLRIIAQCDPGYHLTGQANNAWANIYTCGLNGKWLPQSPSCTPVDCGDPGIPPNGDRTGDSTIYNSELSFTCDTGYLRLGSVTRRCQPSSVWSGSQPICYAYTCLFSITNGARSTTGPVYTITCNTGYYLSGNTNTVTCTENNGHTQLPSCRPCRYNHLPSVTSITDQGIVRCSDGYAKNMEDSATCGQNGQWDWQGSCITCRYNHLPSVTSITDQGIVRCSDGHAKNMEDSATCGQNGQWDWQGSCINCRNTFTNSRGVDRSGNVECNKFYYSKTDLHVKATCEYRADQAEWTFQGQEPCAACYGQSRVRNSQSITYDGIVTCNPGYTSKTITRAETCDSQGNWIWMGQCVRIQCTTPSITNGATRPASGATIVYNTQFLLSCSTGYYVTNETQTTTWKKFRCWNGGRWSPHQPSCERIQCTAPSFTYGATRPASGATFVYNSQFLLSCSTGYYVTNEAQTTTSKNFRCWNGGRWSPHQPSCERIQCTAPSITNGATRPASGATIVYNSQFLLSCSTGHYVTNEAQTTTWKKFRCWNGGRWSPHQPSCERQTCAVPRRTTRWTVSSSEAPVKYQQNIEYTCGSGYYVTGEHQTVTRGQLQCGANGIWSPTNPTCSPNTCEAPANNEAWNVSRPGVNVTFQQTVHIYCNTGYYVTGRNQRVMKGTFQCGNNGVWDPEMPKCKRKIC